MAQAEQSEYFSKTFEDNRQETVSSPKGGHKIVLVLILGLMSAVAPLATDMYLPALQKVATDFHATDFAVQLSLSFFFFAFAFGQLFYGPLSEAFGRKKPLYIGMGVFIFATFGCVLTTEIEAFVALRFFQALGGCAAIVIARAMVTDIFDTQEASGMYAMIMMVSSLAPMFAPSIGVFLLEYFNWRSIFYALLFLGIFLLICILFFLPETHKTAKNHSSDNNLNFLKICVSYFKLLKDYRYLALILACSFSIGGLFAYIGSSSFIFMNVYHLSEMHYAWLFGVNALSLIFASQFNVIATKYLMPHIVLRYGIAASVLFGVGMVFASIGQEDTFFNFFFFECMLMGFIFTLGFILPNATALAMARHRQVAGMASALLGTVQFAIAGGIIALVGMFDTNTPIMLACAIASCSLVSGVIYYFYQHESLE